MAYGDNWSLKDFHEELIAIMQSEMLQDVDEALRIETEILNGNLSEEDKLKIINQNI